ncbi:hypothetical protein HOLleu_34779 [Holothuria leucospilota]|uniref:Uncharacterized protein n=1 Tax=Holothuria leucospilota TaxID=206669 RepID=A0A9Q0YLQ5_HOLLE|nr:hypothetical protein HOLleu_34779 [Holothuria leucospilota]
MGVRHGFRACKRREVRSQERMQGFMKEGPCTECSEPGSDDGEGIKSLFGHPDFWKIPHETVGFGDSSNVNHRLCPIQKQNQ